METMSAVYFGLVVGLFLTYVVRVALTPLLPRNPESVHWVELAIGALLCYTCISLLIQTKDDFRFIIPYVEFSKEVKGRQPYVLDTSVMIDGRIADVVETDILDTQLVVPRFAISELQGIADSSDKMRRSRGRRGLDVLNRLKSNPKVDLQIFDRELPEFAGQDVDNKLVLLTKHLNGKLITNDYNLNKVAKAYGAGGHQSQRSIQCTQADVLARRIDRCADREARRGARPRRGISGRRHDGGRRRRPRPSQPVVPRGRHQRSTNSRRPNGVRPL